MDRRAVVRAAVLSGAPSTAWAVVTGGDPLAAPRAAGTLVPGFRDEPGLLRGLLAHAAVSLVWGVPVNALCRRRWQGALAGVAIAALDLGVVARRYPAVRALPTVPQLADHVAFGILATGRGIRSPRRGARCRPPAS